MGKSSPLKFCKKAMKVGGVLGASTFGFLYAYSQMHGKATQEEQDFRYPADDLIDANYDNGYSSTYAIDIDAPAYAVYRYLKQLGCNRTGSFSSEFLERTFARLPFFNSYEIQEEFQVADAIAPGDVAAFDYHGMTMEWTDIVPGKYLVSWTDTKMPPAAPGSYAFRFPGMRHFAAAWCFYLVPLKGERCRLINHWRIGYEDDNLFNKVVNWLNIELVGGCMTNMQNAYLKRVAEFRKKPQLSGRIMRGLLGGRFFGSQTPAGRWDGTPLFEETETQWMRFGRRNPAVAEIRPPVTDNPHWPPSGPETPWDGRLDEDYYVDWEEPEFSWDEQIRQKNEKTYLHGWGKKH